MKFWVLDVGQGDCTVIELPNGEWIVIDVGPIGSPLVQWIAKKQPAVVRIRAIIITHNHTDHYGAMRELLALSNVQFNEFYAISGGTNKTELKRAYHSYLGEIYKLEKQGRCQQIPINVRLTSPQVIWEDVSIGVALKLVYPDPGAVHERDAIDDASVIAVLTVKGMNQFTWAGDNYLRTVLTKTGTSPFPALHGPHHGAPKDRRESGFARTLANINPRIGVFSFASKNVYASRALNEQLPITIPNGRYLSSLAAKGCRVGCTQLTSQCDKARFGSSAPWVFQGSMQFGIPQPKTGVQCRGAMLWELMGNTFEPDGHWAKHAAEVAKLATPLCRSSLPQP